MDKLESFKSELKHILDKYNVILAVEDALDYDRNPEGESLIVTGKDFYAKSKETGEILYLNGLVDFCD